jgi:prevent-host-death family protein
MTTMAPSTAKRDQDSNSGISVAEAKAHFSSVIATVERRRRPVTILRRGRPVVQIVPVPVESPTLYGSMRGTVVELGDIVGATGEDWGFGDE